MGLLEIHKPQTWAGPEWSYGHFADRETKIWGERKSSEVTSELVVQAGSCLPKMG